jgi:hypothetical protein
VEQERYVTAHLDARMIAAEANTGMNALKKTVS